MRLILFGATGGTGAAVIQARLAGKQPLTVFVREPARLGKAQAAPSVRVIQGDVFDAPAVAAAIAGHDAVITALGTNPWRHTDVCSVGTRHIVAGMKAAGARRLVVVSSIGAGETRAQSGTATRFAAATILKRALDDKSVMETELAASGLDWVIVRPTLLTSGKRQGVRAATDGSIRGGSVARADLADFLLDQLASDTWLRRAPVITTA